MGAVGQRAQLSWRQAQRPVAARIDGRRNWVTVVEAADGDIHRLARTEFTGRATDCLCQGGFADIQLAIAKRQIDRHVRQIVNRHQQGTAGRSNVAYAVGDGDRNWPVAIRQRGQHVGR